MLHAANIYPPMKT